MAAFRADRTVPSRVEAASPWPVDPPGRPERRGRAQPGYEPEPECGGRDGAARRNDGAARKDVEHGGDAVAAAGADPGKKRRLHARGRNGTLASTKSGKAQLPGSLHDIVDVYDKHNMMARPRLRRYLRHFGQYPEYHRLLIWRYLLQLPENRDTYWELLGKGVHPCVVRFNQLFPMKCFRTQKIMERILSGLAHWSPVFEQLDYLPAMVFPFVKTFDNNAFACFETLMTVVVNWCQKWWEYYPNSPVEVLDLLEGLLEFHEPELLRHFVRHRITSQVYGWTLLQTCFSEVFPREEWARLWDHMFTEQPVFLYYITLAFLHVNRTALLAICRVDDFRSFFQRQNQISLDRLLSTAYRFRRATPTNVSPAGVVEPFRPLLRGQYPVFNVYPRFVVNYQSRLREQIRKEEEQFLLNH